MQEATIKRHGTMKAILVGQITQTSANERELYVLEAIHADRKSTMLHNVTLRMHR